MLQDLLRKKGMWIAWLLMNDLVGTGTNIQAAESPTGFFLRLGIHSFAKKMSVINKENIYPIASMYGICTYI